MFRFLNKLNFKPNQKSKKTKKKKSATKIITKNSIICSAASVKGQSLLYAHKINTFCKIKINKTQLFLHFI